MSWTTPQQYQLWSQRPPPMGWVGPWPPPPGSGPWPPGFPGPPPNPTAVPQNSWSDGQWMFNPQFAAFQGSGGPAAAQPWAPWQWGSGQQQQQQNFNPYKRVPKPADESYWKTELKDNGLGLEGMGANDKCVGNCPGAACDSDASTRPPSTPWAWVPRNLREVSNGQDVPSREAAPVPPTQSRSQPHRSDTRSSSHVQDQNQPVSTAERPHRSSTSTPRHDSYSRTSSRRPSLDRTGTTNDRSDSRAREDARRTETSSSSRRTSTRDSASASASATVPGHPSHGYRDSSSAAMQSASASTPSRAEGHRDSGRSSLDASQSRPSYRSPSPSPARHYSSSSSRQNAYNPPTAATASVPRAAVAADAPRARRPETSSSSAYRAREPVSASASAAAVPASRESYTQKRELHTTFSSRVVRTPDSYPVTSPPAASTQRAVEDRSYPPSSSTTPLRSRTQDTTASSRAPPRPPSRSQTHPYTAPPMMHASSSGSSTEIVIPPRPAGLTPPRPPSTRPGQQPVTRHHSMPAPIKTAPVPAPIPAVPKPEPEANNGGLAALTHFSDASVDGLLSPLMDSKPTPSTSPPPQRPQAAQTISSSSISSASRQAGGITHTGSSQTHARAMSRSRTYPTVPSGPMYDAPDVITPSVSASASISTRPSPQYQTASAPRSPYEPTSASSTAPVTPTSGVSPSRRYPPFGASQYPTASSAQPSPSKDAYGASQTSARVSASTGASRSLARHQTYDSAQLQERSAAPTAAPTSRHESYGAIPMSSRTTSSSTARAPSRQATLEADKYDTRAAVPNGLTQPSPNGQAAYDAYGRPMEPVTSPTARGPVTRHATYDAPQYDSSPSSEGMVPPRASPSRNGMYSSSRGAISASSQAYQSSSRQASAPVSASSSRSTSRTRPSYEAAPIPSSAAVPSPYKYSSRDRRGQNEEPLVIPPKPEANEMGELNAQSPAYPYSSRGRRAVAEEPTVVPPIPARQYETPPTNGVTSASTAHRVQTQRERDRSREQSIFIPPKPDDIWGEQEVKSPPVSALRTHHRRDSRTQHEVPASSTRDPRDSSSAMRSSSRTYPTYETPTRKSDERPSHTSSTSASYSRYDARGSSSASKTVTSPYTPESRSSSAATARPSASQTYTTSHEVKTSSATRESPATSPYDSRHPPSHITSSSSPYGQYSSRTSSTRPSPSSQPASTMARSSSQGQSPMYSSQSHARSGSASVPHASTTNGHSPSGYSSRSGGSSSSSRQTHSSSGSGNPLPAPPQPVSIPRTPRTPHTVSASSSAQAHGDANRRHMRKGFWNRRGDHLTGDLQVVYAPAHRVNPPDLQMYPSPTEGYLDHQGVFLQYDPNRPELKDSLPRHGRPAMRPYDSVRAS